MARMTRTERNQIRDRKRTRRARASIHAAMGQAVKMKRSKRRGTANLDANMAKLGFHRIGPDGAGLPPEQKFAPAT